MPRPRREEDTHPGQQPPRQPPRPPSPLRTRLRPVPHPSRLAPWRSQHRDSRARVGCGRWASGVPPRDCAWCAPLLPRPSLRLVIFFILTFLFLFYFPLLLNVVCSWQTQSGEAGTYSRFVCTPLSRPWAPFSQRDLVCLGIRNTSAGWKGRCRQNTTCMCSLFVYIFYTCSFIINVCFFNSLPLRPLSHLIK